MNLKSHKKQSKPEFWRKNTTNYGCPRVCKPHPKPSHKNNHNHSVNNIILCVQKFEKNLVPIKIWEQILFLYLI